MQAEALLNLHRHEEAYSGFQNAPAIDINISIQLFGSKVTANFLAIQSQLHLASGRLATDNFVLNQFIFMVIFLIN